MRGPLFDLQWLRVEMPVISYHAPSRGRGMPEGQGVGRRRKRAKPTSSATRHLLPEEGGRSGKKTSTPFPWKGDARRAGGWPKAKRAKSTSGATRHLLPEEGGRSGENYLLPSRGRGMPEGQGVDRRRKRAKPTSGATRHLLSEEGGRSGEKTFPPFRGRGGCPKGRGLAEDEREQGFLALSFFI